LFFRILVSLNRACAVGQPESIDIEGPRWILRWQPRALDK